MTKKVVEVKELKEIAAKARLLAVQTAINSGLGHLGGSLSSLDILTVLYFRILNISPDMLNDPNRDRFILSKGHASVGLYTILTLKGIIDESLLSTFRIDGGIMAGHPEPDIPGIEHGTGSLGHGLSVGVGMALAAKLDSRPYKTYIILGDGELQEGSIWEAAMSAAHFKLNNLIAIVDRNRLQIDGNTEEILQLGKLSEKWDSFGWSVKTIDGHSIPELIEVLESIPFEDDKPSIIIANTVKGKGVSFMENSVKWHGGAPKGEEAISAIEQLTKSVSQLQNEKG